MISNILSSFLVRVRNSVVFSIRNELLVHVLQMNVRLWSRARTWPEDKGGVGRLPNRESMYRDNLSFI